MVSDVHFSSSSTEWFTPEWILQESVNLMGSIDLDPASPSHSGPVPSAQYFTPEDNGLTQDWHGRVFLNPPYYRGGLDKWIKKAIEEYRSGRVSELLLLIPARPGTKWFKRLDEYPWCAVNGRIKFLNPDTSSSSAPFPSAIVYLGENIHEFYLTFHKHGTIYRRLM